MQEKIYCVSLLTMGCLMVFYRCEAMKHKRLLKVEEEANKKKMQELELAIKKIARNLP